MAVEIVAEFTTNHLGNMWLLVNMAAGAEMAGADCIKMQRKNVKEFYSQEKLDSLCVSPYGKTYGEYRQAFEILDWLSFDAVCVDLEIPWFLTPQDTQSFSDDYEPLAGQMNRYKISSTNARKPKFIDFASREIPTDYEIVVSVAGQTLAEIEKLVNLFRDHRRLWILHCVAEYPCPSERLRLGNIAELRKHFAGDQVHIGYSGHEVGFLPSLAAVEQYGAEMVERHFCISRNSFAHHIECSLEPDEFKAMVGSIRNGSNEAWSLPAEAYRSEFGLSEQERPFLEDQQYGR